MADVCSPYMQEACPEDNATALEVMGKPFVEMYSHCGQQANYTQVTSVAGVVLGANMVLFTGLGLHWLRKRQCEGGDAEVEARSGYNLLTEEA